MKHLLYGSCVLTPLYDFHCNKLFKFYARWSHVRLKCPDSLNRQILHISIQAVVDFLSQLDVLLDWNEWIHALFLFLYCSSLFGFLFLLLFKLQRRQQLLGILVLVVLLHHGELLHQFPSIFCLRFCNWPPLSTDYLLLY